MTITKKNGIGKPPSFTLLLLLASLCLPAASLLRGGGIYIAAAAAAASLSMCDLLALAPFSLANPSWIGK